MHCQPRISPVCVQEPIIGMILLGALVAFSNRRKLFLGWFLLLSILCLLGLYDFYLWEYDYGHNLDPKAPIQVPGMTYQPPLIGEKMLLNFNAMSYPATGFWFLMAALAFSFFAYFSKSRIRKKAAAGAWVVCLLAVAGCTPQPVAIHYGEDVCHYCQMGIADERYGAELVTSKGKVAVFDATECLLRYMQEQTTTEEDYAYMLTNTWDAPGEFNAWRNTTWLVSKELPSPMGAYLTAFRSAEEAKKVQQHNGGKLYGWKLLPAYLTTL